MMVLELMSEFVEDQVRQVPSRPFSLADLRQSLDLMLQDADLSGGLQARDDAWVSDWLDRHPLLRRDPSAASWKPGLNRGSLSHA
jgi:hypothetical protein